MLCVEYPGYSLYEGEPTESSINSDAKGVYKYLSQKMGYDTKDIILMGRSIGTGVSIN